MKGRKFTEEHLKNIIMASKKRIGIKGTPHTEEHKKHMSELMKGRIVSEETLIKMRTVNLGKKQSAETIAKRSKSMKGIVFTDEHKKKISKALKGNCYVAVGKDNVRSKPILQIDIVTKQIMNIFESACLAEVAFGKKRTTGSTIKVANGQQKTAYGFEWKWQSNYSLMTIIEIENEK